MLQEVKAPEKKSGGHPCIEMDEANIPPAAKNEVSPYTPSQAHEWILINGMGIPPGGLHGRS